MIDGLLPFVYTVSAVVTGGLAVLTSRNRRSSGSGALAGTLSAVTLWLVAIVVAGQFTTLAAMLRWAAVAFMGLGLTVAFLFLFALRYAGYDDVLAGRRALLLGIHPVVLTLVALTNHGTGVELLGVGGHELFYESAEMGAYSEGGIEWAWAFWVHTAYSYLLVAASTVLILRTTVTSNDTYRWQSASVGFAIVVPWIANVVDLTLPNVDGLLALGFGVSGVLLALSVHRFELSNVTPVARPVVMEAVADGVLVVDDRGRVTDLNERARGLLDLDDGALGAGARAVLPAALEAFVDAATAPTRDRVDHDGRTLEVETTPFGHDADDAGGRVFVIRDVTEQHAYRRELERKTERLDRFASVVSHDLRNPLSIARGYTDVAEESGDDEAFEQVQDAHDRMESLIEDVLLMAREGETATDPGAVALDALAERAWATVDTGDAILDVFDDVTVCADSDRSVQLFENLFRNTVEHGSTSSRPRADDSVEHASTSNRPRSGDAVVHGRRDHDRDALRVTVGELDDADGFFVADDGAGIDPSVRDALFEAGVSGGSGTGLGLAIVHRIADAHGWTVTASESDAGGARFEFRGVEAVEAVDDVGPDPIPDDPLST